MESLGNGTEQVKEFIKPAEETVIEEDSSDEEP